MGSQGNPLAYSHAFAENEERSPWTPLHVQHGFDASDSCVTAFLGGWYAIGGTGLRDGSWRETLRRSLHACDASLGPALIVDPLVAESLVRLAATADELIQPYRTEDIHVLVVGGETTPTWRMSAAWYGGTMSVDAWR
jgi:hypothetical protein